MDTISAAATSEDFIDISAVRILDLRTLGQDEICCLAHLCGDVPERLQDLVNVIVDKSIFNESAGSKRQTFDRDRLPRNKERRLSSGSASAQLHLAIESAGRSHKDLIVHLCRQLKISEQDDRAMFQPQVTQASGVVAEGNRSMSLKRMARASASLAGRFDGAMVPLSKAADEVLVNGKELPFEVLHRSSKKMKTKEEARRRAAESSQAGGGVASEMQGDKHALLAVKITSLGHDEPAPLKDIAAEGMTPPAQIRNDFWSPGGGMARASNHLVEAPETSKFTRESRPHKGLKLLCTTCGGSFANMYSLRRHTVSTGHAFDAQLLRTGIVRKKKKKALNKSNLRCSCGNTYATPYTLRRHAITNGHSLDTTSTAQATTPAGDHHQQVVKGEDIDGNAGVKLGKQKLGALLPERAWKGKIGHFTCRHCHRQFIRKKVYIRHMSTHFQRQKKKNKTGHGLLGGPLGASSDEVKPRIGRPPKHDRDVDAKQERVGGKQKREPASLDRRVRSRKAERRRAPSQKPQSYTCQECGKIYDEFSRYTGHLSMHARLRKVLVGETSSPASAILKKNMLNLKELSALGFRKLLNDKTGTYLSGLPAKLLFSESGFASKTER